MATPAGVGPGTAPPPAPRPPRPGRRSAPGRPRAAPSAGGADGSRSRWSPRSGSWACSLAGHEGRLLLLAVGVGEPGDGGAVRVHDVQVAVTAGTGSIRREQDVATVGGERRLAV